MNIRDELGIGDEMVLVKMLMKIGPPMMRGSLVMSMASISPSRREVSPDGIAPLEGKSAPAQVPPRDGGASS